MTDKKKRYLLKSEFASLAKIHPSMVSKMVKSGKIEAVKKSGKIKIDLHSDLVKEYLTKRKEKEPSIDFEVSPKKEGETAEPIPAKSLSINPTPEELTEYSKSDLDRLKAISEIRKKDQDTLIKRGELIERSAVENIFNKIFSNDEKYLIKLGDNIASDAAALIGVDDVALKRKLADFINDQVQEALQRSKKASEEYLLNLTD